VNAEQELLLRTVAAPLAVGGLTGLFCALPRLPDVARQTLAALAAAGAVLLVFWFERGLPNFPPTRALHWLWPVAGAALLAAFCGFAFPKQRLWFLGAALIFVVWTHATRGGKWHDDADVWMVIFLCAAGWLVSLWAVGKTLSGRMGCLALSGIFGSLAVTLLLTKSLLLAQLSGAMACVLLGLVICGRTVFVGLFAPLLCVAVFLCLHGYLFSRLQFTEMLLLAFGGLPVLTSPFVVRFFPGWIKAWIAAALAVLVPALMALWVLFRVRPWEDPYF